MQTNAHALPQLLPRLGRRRAHCAGYNGHSRVLPRACDPPEKGAFTACWRMNGHDHHAQPMGNRFRHPHQVGAGRTSSDVLRDRPVLWGLENTKHI